MSATTTDAPARDTGAGRSAGSSLQSQGDVKVEEHHDDDDDPVLLENGDTTYAAKPRPSSSINGISDAQRRYNQDLARNAYEAPVPGRVSDE